MVPPDELAGCPHFITLNPVKNIEVNQPAASSMGPLPARRTGNGRQRLSAPKAAVLDLLAQQPQPVSVNALAALQHQHPNTLREHLDALVASGLATREAARPVGRGRPAWLYSAVPGEGSSGPGEYAGLASALAGALAHSSDDPNGEAMEAGVAWGHELAQRLRDAEPATDTPEGDSDRPDDGSPAAARRSDIARHEVLRLLDDLGFAPETHEQGDLVMLRRCPLLQAAHKHPDIVCNVHKGLVRGALEVFGGDPELIELTPFSDPGACRLEVRLKGNQDDDGSCTDCDCPECGGGADDASGR